MRKSCSAKVSKQISKTIKKKAAKQIRERNMGKKGDNMSNDNTELIIESLATRHHRSELACALTNATFGAETFGDIPAGIIKQAFDRYNAPEFQKRRTEILCENYGPLIIDRDSSCIAIDNVNTLVMLFEKPLLEVLMAMPEKRCFCGAADYSDEEIADAITRYDIIEASLTETSAKLSTKDLDALSKDFIG